MNNELQDWQVHPDIDTPINDLEVVPYEYTSNAPF